MQVAITVTWVYEYDVIIKQKDKLYINIDRKQKMEEHSSSDITHELEYHILQNYTIKVH